MKNSRNGKKSGLSIFQLSKKKYITLKLFEFERAFKKIRSPNRFFYSAEKSIKQNSLSKPIIVTLFRAICSFETRGQLKLETPV